MDCLGSGLLIPFTFEIRIESITLWVGVVEAEILFDGVDLMFN